MAFHYATQGIILKQRDLKEASRVFTVFSKEYGKLSLAATSVRKSASKLRGGLQLFSLSQLSFVQGKQKKVLVEAIPLRQYSKDFAPAAEIASLIEQYMPEEEKDERVWELLVNAFSELEKGSVNTQEFFTPQFMTLAGYGT